MAIAAAPALRCLRDRFTGVADHVAHKSLAIWLPGELALPAAGRGSGCLAERADSVAAGSCHEPQNGNAVLIAATRAL